MLKGKKVSVTRTSETNQQDRQRVCKGEIEARSRNHSCCGKAMSIIHSECVSVALVIHHAKRLSSAVCLDVP